MATSEKPDFQVGDRVSGELKTQIYAKQFPSKVLKLKEMQMRSLEAGDYRGLTDPYFANRFPEPVWVGDPEYEDGWVTKVERKGNQEFFRVAVAPYKVKDKWHMLIRDKEANESEVDCAEFHLVGERQPPPAPKPPLISKKLRREIKMKLTRPAIVTLIIVAIVGLLFLVSIGNYNDLVRSRNQVNNSRAQIDTEYTRRYDLIDNIVQSVQGSQAQESDVFGKIAEARKLGGSQGSQTSDQAQQANDQISNQIALLPRLQEQYPELRSNDQVSKLIGELQGTNNTIRDKKNLYNDTVTNYNNNITSFPKSIFAGIFNFDKEKLLSATAQERVNPKVELDREKN